MQFFIVPFFIAFALTLWGRNRYRKIYGQEVEFTLPSKITGAELVERILKNYGIEDVSVVKGRGVLEDFYAPEKKRVSLAPHHHDGINFPSLALAAQQAGKAIQHHEGHRPILWRTTAIRWTVYLSIPLLVVAAVTMVVSSKTLFPLILLFWSLIAFWNVATIPTELDAGERVKKQLSEIKAFRNLDERVGVERVMGAASTQYLDGIFTVASWAARLVLPWMKSDSKE